MFKVTKRTLTAAAVITAASAPSTAYGRVDLNPTQPQQAPPTQSQQAQLQSYRQAIANQLAPNGTLAGPVQAQSAGPTGASSQRFQWDDAGIGAAAMLVLLGVGAGSAVAISRRRAHQPRVS